MAAYFIDVMNWAKYLHYIGTERCIIYNIASHFTTNVEKTILAMEKPTISMVYKLLQRFDDAENKRMIRMSNKKQTSDFQNKYEFRQEPTTSKHNNGENKNRIPNWRERDPENKNDRREVLNSRPRVKIMEFNAENSEEGEN
ncbi:hypothetical protein JTB14_017956 [Gonioctena quinquepunctata]|nr:hypothetical protein JTB14_017956 [Gonioctena quinquepunctata]